MCPPRPPRGCCGLSAVCSLPSDDNERSPEPPGLISLVYTHPESHPKPTRTRTRPNHTKFVQRLRTAPCPQALRSARGAWRAHGPLSEETAHTPCTTRSRQGPQARSGTGLRSHMHGHMHSDSLGAAAGFAPERCLLTGGIPSVSNAGVFGGDERAVLQKRKIL